MTKTAKAKGQMRGIEQREATDGTVSYRWTINLTKPTRVRRRGPWTTSLAEAINGRVQAMREVEAGESGSPAKSAKTIDAAMDEFLAGIESGTIIDRKKERYKPATVRGYERGWRLRLKPVFGGRELTSISHGELQRFVEGMAAEGYSASTIRNTLDPLRRVYVRAIKLGEATVNPCADLDVENPSGGRDRVADKAEAETLIARLDADNGDQALWSVAFYGGLRSGELRALQVEDVDLAARVIHVRRGWDDEEGSQEPKSKNAVRKVPLIPRVVRLLDAHLKATGRTGTDLVFGRSATEEFLRSTVRARALRAWGWKETKELQEDGSEKTVWQPKGGEVETSEPIGLHEARHTCASFMIAAGANAKALSVVMGHASIQITFDRYGHLFKGGEAEVGELLSKYINGEPK